MRSLWTFRRWIVRTAIGNLRYRYAGSALGALWNVLTPLALLVVYTFVFTRVLALRFAASGLPARLFPLYLSAGFLMWIAFVEGLTQGTFALVSNATYLQKLPIPEQVFVAQAVVSAFFSMLISIGLLVGLALVFGQPPHWYWLLLPIVAVLWQLFAFGVSLALSVLNVFMRDIGQMLGVLFQVWMWSIPVVYLEDILPTSYRAILPLNPPYSFLTATRDLYLYSQWPPLWVWGAMLGWGLVSTVIGFAILGRLRSDIRDVL